MAIFMSTLPKVKKDWLFILVGHGDGLACFGLTRYDMLWGKGRLIDEIKN